MPFTLAPQHEIETVSVVERLKRARSRYRSLVSVRSIAQWICFTLVLTALAGYLDWRYHLAPLTRALALTSLISLGIVLLVRRLIYPYQSVSDLFRVALRVEKKFPQLNDSLASAILFLQIPEEEKEQSSPYLRRETIDRAQEACVDLNFNEAFTCRGTRRFVLGACVLMAASTWVVQAAPMVADVSLQRLLFPFSSMAWPTKTRIEILEPRPLPSRLARGSTLELKVAVGGVVPERARLMISFEGGPPQEQVYPIPRDDQAQEAVFTLRIDGQRITRDFRFQIKANDAETEWYSVAVRPAPVLVPLNGRPSPQMHLDYPAYTGLAASDLPDATSVVDAPAGTAVTLRAAVDRPIVKSWLTYQPDHNHLILASYLAPLGSSQSVGYATSSRLGRDVWQPIALRVAEDGKLIETSFIPRLPGAYVLHFEDETGLGGTRLLDFRVRPDPAPSVTLLRPSASRDTMVLLPSAEITLQASAVDKIFGLKQVFLEYRISHNGEFRSLPLFDASLLQTALPKLSGLMPRVLAIPAGNLPRFFHFDVNQRIDLQRFTHVTGAPLQEGDVLILRVAANDFDTVNPIKQPGRSHEIELQIVGRSQLEAVIQQALANLRGELLQMREMQHEARSKIQEALKHQQQSGSLRPEDMEKILQAEQLQQQIRGRIQSPEDGLLAEAARLKQSVKDNQLPKSRSTDRIDAAFGELSRIANEEMEPIEQALNEARKPAATESATLARAERGQKDVEETLKSLLERLEPWSGAGEVRGEARSILGELGRQIEQTERLKEKQKADSSGTKREQLSPEQQAELDHAALRPDRMGDRTRQLLEKIDRLVLEKKSAIQEKEDLLQKKEAEAKLAAEQALKKPMNSSEQKALQKRAEDLREEAQQLAQTRAGLIAEMEALQKSIADSNGRQLKGQLQNVGDQVRQNRLEDAIKTQQTAKADLQKLIDSLEEKPSAAADDLLSKKRKEASERLDELIDQQDLLQKKIDSAQGIADPNERREELQKLAREQEQIRQEAEDLGQRLTRLQSEPAAQDLRRAEKQMAAARRQLEDGMPPAAPQEDALEHLEDAQDKLSETRDQDDTELLREKLTRMADLLRGIRDRQSSALAESQRMYEGVKKAKGWAAEKTGAVLRTNLNNLIDQQEGLTKDLENLNEKRFRNFPVFERILKQSAQAMSRAADRLKQRKEDALDQVDGTVAFDDAVESKAFAGIRANQQLAARRIDQLLDALKPDQELLESRKSAAADKPAPPNDPKKSGTGEDLPPLAQLKALRALQVDLAERTKAFDKAHPDGIMNLSDDEAAELKALQEAQEDVANSIRDLTPTAPQGDLP